MAKQSRKKTEYSRSKGNLNVLNSKPNSKTSKDSGIKLDKDGFNMSKGSNIFIGSLNLNSHLKRRHDKFYKHSNLHWWVDVILAGLVILLLVALLSITLWNPKENVKLNSYVQDEPVVSGQVETLVLDYESQQRNIDNKLSIKLPESFELLGVTPSKYFNEHTNTFNLPDLTKNANGEIKITGYPIGELNSQQAVSFQFSCQNCSESEYLNSLIYNIEDSTLETELEAPEYIYQDSNQEIDLKVKNNSNKDFTDIIIKVNPEWDISGNNLIQQDNTIKIDQLRAKEDTTLNFNIKTNSKAKEVPLHIKTYLKHKREKLLQHQLEKKIDIQNIELDTNLKSSKNNISLDESIPFTLDISNKHSHTLKNVEVELNSLNQNFSVQEINLPQKNSDIELNNKTLILDKLSPQEEVSLDLEVNFQEKELKPRQTIELEAQLSHTLGTKDIDYNIKSNTLKVKSDLNLNSSAYYYSPQGDQLGVGPIPPKVSIPTTYWIFWDLKNSGNTLKNINISADLGENVFLTEQRSVLDGNLNYANIGKRIAWSIDELSTKNQSGQAKFAVKLIPEEDQIGETATLVENIKLTAFDEFTNSKVKFELEDMTTNLKDDKLIKNSGNIVE